MRPLRDDRRRGLLAISAILCTTAMLLVPLAARSSFDLAAQPAAAGIPLHLAAPPPWKSRPIVLLRDPFVAEATAKPATGAAAAHLTTSDGIRVSGVALGPNARALVEIGGSVRMLGIGDSIAGSSIVSIDASGVRLQSGAFFRLEEVR